MIGKMLSRPKAQKNQDGIVAIVVVSVIIVILALMTIGFAKVMDRELRQSLDRALASQANYAAESGINGAREYIKLAAANGTDPTTTGCLNTNSPPGLLPAQTNPFAPNGGDVSGNNIVKYSCIVIDGHPKDLTYENIKRGDSRIFKVILNPVDTLNNLFFSWQNSQISNNAPCTIPTSQPTIPKETAFPAFPGCETGMLRATIYPVPNNINDGAACPDKNTCLANASRTYFLYPNGGGLAIDNHPYNPATAGEFINGNCNIANYSSVNPQLPYAQSTPRYCNSRVSGLSASGASYYYVRITALYQNLSVSVQASNLANTPIGLGGAEAVVDVTGEGNDVLKRLQARVPLGAQVDYPEYALQSLNTVCKKLRLPVGPGGPNDYQTAIIDDSASSNGDLNCQPQL
jgi:Tfp pilus assembly protein PilX